MDSDIILRALGHDGVLDSTLAALQQLLKSQEVLNKNIEKLLEAQHLSNERMLQLITDHRQLLASTAQALLRTRSFSNEAALPYQPAAAEAICSLSPANLLRLSRKQVEVHCGPGSGACTN
jgi:hypothetical protein